MGTGTQGVALGWGLVGLSARAGPQTRLFPHNLHQLDISILNTLAASGAARTFGEGLRRSTVAHFARKVRGTNIVAAKHEQKIQQSHAPELWSCSLRVRGPHFASKVSYSASPQSLAAKKFVNSFNSLLRRLRPPIKFVVMLRPNKFRCTLCPRLPPIKKGVPFRTPFSILFTSLL